MKSFLLVFTLCVAQLIYSQKVSPDSVQKILGTWEIDLRPTPESSPYLKDFQFTNIAGKEFEGIFYDTPFTGGIINTDWGKIYFAFTTADASNSYFHSGYIDGDSLTGLTYCETRKFSLPWRGKKKN